MTENNRKNVDLDALECNNERIKDYIDEVIATALAAYLPISGGTMRGNIHSSASYALIMDNADNVQYKFPIIANKEDSNPFMRMATSHNTNENGLLLQVFSPTGDMAGFNIYSGTSGKRISTDCELPKNYVTGTFSISSSTASAAVTLGFQPSFIVLYGGSMQAYVGTAWATSTGFKTPDLSSTYAGTWTYIAFK